MQINLEKLKPYEDSIFLIREYTQPCFTSPRHYHKEFELTYIEESYGKLYIGNSIVDFKKGDIFLFAPRLIHSYKNPKGFDQGKKSAKATCIWFMPDFLGGDFLKKHQTKNLSVLFKKSESGIRFSDPSVKVAGLIKSIAREKNLNGLIGLLQVLNMLSVQNNVTVLSGNMLNKYYYKHSKDERIDKVIDYVFRNYNRKISAREISELVNMSEAGFSRFFRARTEISFTGFINEVRLSKAQKMLVESSKPIREISRECGYNNLSHFNRQFKLHNETIPRTFREYFRKPGSVRA